MRTESGISVSPPDPDGDGPGDAEAGAVTLSAGDSPVASVGGDVHATCARSSAAPIAMCNERGGTFAATGARYQLTRLDRLPTTIAP